MFYVQTTCTIVVKHIFICTFKAQMSSKLLFTKCITTIYDTALNIDSMGKVISFSLFVVSTSIN